MEPYHRFDLTREFIHALLQAKNAQQPFEVIEDNRLFSTLVVELKDHNSFAQHWVVHNDSLGFTCPDFKEGISSLPNEIAGRTTGGFMYLSTLKKRFFPKVHPDTLEFAKQYLEKLGIQPDPDLPGIWYFVADKLPSRDGTYIVSSELGNVHLAKYKIRVYEGKKIAWWSHNVVGWQVLPFPPCGYEKHKSFSMLQRESSTGSV